MTIEIRTVTEENRADILALHVSESQTSFIEPRKSAYKMLRIAGIISRPVFMLNGELVGFAMYGWFPEYDEANENGRVWLDRFFY